jgi:hypothetical protein
MSCCGHCRDAGDFFNERTAKKELRRYLRKGPDKSTRLLLEAITRQSLHVNSASLLDIGGGIGAIQLELFKKGLGRSVNVDASAAYQRISKKEIIKRSLEDKTEYHFGDFTELAPDLPSAEIVTLDRVICCYPDLEKLLDRSLQKAEKVYAVVYPREAFFMRIGIRLSNLWFRLRKSDFRTYLYPVEKVQSIIQSHGFRQTDFARTFLWRVEIYQRKVLEP